MDTEKLQDVDDPSEGRFRDLGRRAKEGVLWMSISTAAWQIISWILTVMTAEYLAPSEYGVMSLAETLLPYFLLAASFYSRNWIVQAARFDEKDKEAMFTFNVVLGLLSFAAAWVLSPYGAQFYDDPTLTEPFRIIAIGMAMRCFTAVTESTLNRELSFRPFALLTEFVAISRSVLQLYLAYAGYGVWSLVFGHFYRDAAMTLGVMYIGGMPKRFSIDFTMYRAAMKFGIPATTSALLAIVFSSADNVIVGKLLGTEALGFYAFAGYIADMPTAKLNMMLRQVFVSYYSRLKGQPELLAEQFLKVVRVSGVITNPVLVGLSAVATEAVPVLLGDKWLPMVVPLQMMGVICLVRAIVDHIPSLLTSQGFPGRVLVFNILCSTVLPLSFIYAVQHFGLSGVYFVWLVIFPMLSISLLIFLRKSVGIASWRFILNTRASLIASLVMGLAVVAVGTIIGDNLGIKAVLAVKVLVGVIVYGLFFVTIYRNDGLEALRIVKGLKG